MNRRCFASSSECKLSKFYVGSSIVEPQRSQRIRMSDTRERLRECATHDRSPISVVIMNVCVSHLLKSYVAWSLTFFLSRVRMACAWTDAPSSCCGGQCCNCVSALLSVPNYPALRGDFPHSTHAAQDASGDYFHGNAYPLMSVARNGV